MRRYWINCQSESNPYHRYNGMVVLGPDVAMGIVSVYPVDTSSDIISFPIDERYLSPWHPYDPTHSRCFCIRDKPATEAAKSEPVDWSTVDYITDTAATTYTKTVDESWTVQHPDDTAVDRFAAAMRAKLYKKRQEGRSGRQSMTAKQLSALLYEHIHKGDPVDVANIAMMLHQNGQEIEPPEQLPAVDEAMVERACRHWYNNVQWDTVDKATKRFWTKAMCDLLTAALQSQDREKDPLQAEVKELRAENERLKSMTAMTMGVGSGDGKLFVHGDYESIKAAQAIVLERDALREALKDIRSCSSMNAAMNPSPYELTALLGDIHQIADAALAHEGES